MTFNWWRFRETREKNYLSGNRGTAAIEFAILSPVFLLVFMGIFEVGLVMLTKMSLETGIQQVVRFGRTGDVVAGQTQQQTAAALVSTYTFGIVDPNKVVLTVTPYPSFSAMPLLAQAPTTGGQDFGAASQPVLYILSYQWNFFTPLIGKLLAPNGQFIVLKASAVVLNEPF